MADTSFSPATRRPLPLILIRGFGGLDVEDEKAIAYQGFNDGTVYPQKRGENYIYEGFILRFLKSSWRYQDATNVVGYYGNPLTQKPAAIPPELSMLDKRYFSGDKVVIDPAMALHLLKSTDDPCKTLWVFRYYDLNDRTFAVYGKALLRLIDLIRDLAALKGIPKPKVNIIAHSMGGLLVRQAVQQAYPSAQRSADECINKIVTLGTPHQGISFQILKNWIRVGAEDELEHFNPEFQASSKPVAYKNFKKHFPLDRLLTVVGTNYRSYSVGIASGLNRLFSLSGESGLNYNRSDGLVKQTAAQIPGAPRTFVHKCHGGADSLITSRESFEIATRFFFGNVKARLLLLKANIKRGRDWFGKSEFFFGVSIKPRKVDFDLFHQSAEAENCYGAFRKEDLSDKDVDFPWLADESKRHLIWEGWLDTTPILADQSIESKEMVLRLDFYVGERDLFGIGFSDNVIFRKQYYVRARLQKPVELYLHTDERFLGADVDTPQADKMRRVKGGWEFDITGTGFDGKFRIEVDLVPEDGPPAPLE
jgi:hypothetical protein